MLERRFKGCINVFEYWLRIQVSPLITAGGIGAPNLMKAYGRAADSICEPYRPVNSLCSSSRYW